MLAEPASTNSSEFFMGSFWEGPWHFMSTAFTGCATCWGSLFNEWRTWRAKLDAGIHQSIWIFMGSYWEGPWHFMSTAYSGGATFLGSLFNEWRTKLDAGRAGIHQSVGIFYWELLGRSLTYHVTGLYQVAPPVEVVYLLCDAQNQMPA